MFTLSLQIYEPQRRHKFEIHRPQHPVVLSSISCAFWIVSGTLSALTDGEGIRLSFYG